MDTHDIDYLLSQYQMVHTVDILNVQIYIYCVSHYESIIRLEDLSLYIRCFFVVVVLYLSNI